MSESGLGYFTCASCGETFEKVRSDEEAHAEAVEIFGEDELSDGIEVVCDDCWQKQIAEYPPEDYLRRSIDDD